MPKPSTIESCPVCQMPDEDERKELEKKLMTRQLTHKDVAPGFGVGPEVIYNHMMHHFGKQQTAIAKKDDEEFKLTAKPRMSLNSELEKQYDQRNILYQEFIRMANRIDEFYSQDNKTPVQTDAILKQVEQVRKLAVTIAELEGKINKAQSVTYVQYNALQQMVLGELCPNCQGRVMKTMENLNAHFKRVENTPELQRKSNY